MIKTKLSQKMLLIAAGIIIALVCAEVILRSAGIVYSIYRKESNKNIRGKSSYKILCLGDSFTLGIGAKKGYDYPKQLENLFKENKSANDVIVINAGIGGQNSSELLYSLDKNLDKYSPDLVIIMIGINDGHNTHLHDWALGRKGLFVRVSSWVKSLRVYKLFNIAILSRKINKEKPIGSTTQREETNKIKEESISLSRHTSFQEKDLLDNITKLFEHQNELARKLLIETANNENVWGYINLAKQYNAYDLIEEIIMKVLMTNQYDEWLHFTLGRIYEEQGKWKKAESVFKHILANNPQNRYIRFDLAELYIAQNKFDHAESILKDSIKIQGNTTRGNKLLLYCYKMQGRIKEIDKLRQAVAKYEGITDFNIAAIQRKVLKRNIDLIIMNYPRSNYINSTAIIPKVRFIDNFKTFSNIPRDEENKLFSADNLHCNRYGYKIIARNVFNDIKMKSIK